MQVYGNQTATFCMNWQIKDQVVTLSKQSSGAHGTRNVIYESIFKGSGLPELILVLPLQI